MLTSFPPLPALNHTIPNSNSSVSGAIESDEENGSVSEASSTSTLIQSSNDLVIRNNFAHRYTHEVVNAALGLGCAMFCTFLIMVKTLSSDKESGVVYGAMLVGMGIIEVGLLVTCAVLENQPRARVLPNERRPLLA